MQWAHLPHTTNGFANLWVRGFLLVHIPHLGGRPATVLLHYIRCLGRLPQSQPIQLAAHHAKALEKYLALNRDDGCGASRCDQSGSWRKEEGVCLRDAVMNRCKSCTLLSINVRVDTYCGSRIV